MKIESPGADSASGLFLSSSTLPGNSVGPNASPEAFRRSQASLNDDRVLRDFEFTQRIEKLAAVPVDSNHPVGEPNKKAPESRWFRGL